MEDGGGDAFAGFQDHVADEAVADHDFHGTLKQVATLDVADEMDGGPGEELEGVLGEGVTLGVLRADGEQADAGLLVAENFLGKDGAHHGVVEEVLGAGVDVGAGIDQDEQVCFRRHDRGNAGAADAGEGAEADGGGGDHRPGVAGGDGGVGLLVADGLDAAEDGVVFFAAEGLDGRIAHLDDGVAVVDLEAGVGFFLAQFFVFGPDFRFLAEEEEFLDLGEVREGLDGGGHRSFRGEITPHGIERDFHEKVPAKAREDRIRPRGSRWSGPGDRGSGRWPDRPRGGGGAGPTCRGGAGAGNGGA